MLGKQLQHGRLATAADGMGHQRHLVRIAARREHQADMLDVVGVDRGGKGVGAGHRGPVLEQDADTVRVLGVGRVVEGLAVVRVGAGLEESARQLGVMLDAGRAVERRHAAVLVDERAVRVCAAVEQLARERRRVEARVARIDEGWALQRPAGGVRVAVPAAAAHDGHPAVVLELGVQRERPLRTAAASRHRGPDKLVRTRRRCDERRPARVAVLARDHELGPCQDSLTPAEPLECFGVARLRRAKKFLRLLAQLLHVHHDLLRRGPCPRRRAGVEIAIVVSRGIEVGTALSADRLRPRARGECIYPRPVETFAVTATDGAARAGVLRTAHGDVPTPAFMPVGTKATVKGVDPDELRALRAPIVLGNTYHLFFRPGIEVIAELGGLHAFMGWDGPILTDSGGFQVFSLRHTIVRADDGGVTFRSVYDGTRARFTPEQAATAQAGLGSDIAMCLDVCPPANVTRDELDAAVRRTTTWAARQREAPGPRASSSSGSARAGRIASCAHARSRRSWRSTSTAMPSAGCR